MVLLFILAFNSLSYWLRGTLRTPAVEWMMYKSHVYANRDNVTPGILFTCCFLNWCTWPCPISGRVSWTLCKFEGKDTCAGCVRQRSEQVCWGSRCSSSTRGVRSILPWLLSSFTSFCRRVLNPTFKIGIFPPPLSLSKTKGSQLCGAAIYSFILLVKSLNTNVRIMHKAKM